MQLLHVETWIIEHRCIIKHYQFSFPNSCHSEHGVITWTLRNYVHEIVMPQGSGRTCRVLFVSPVYKRPMKHLVLQHKAGKKCLKWHSCSLWREMEAGRHRERWVGKKGISNSRCSRQNKISTRKGQCVHRKQDVFPARRGVHAGRWGGQRSCLLSQ